MPLFKRKQKSPQIDPAVPRLHGKDEIGAMLVWQVEHATSAGSSFSVLYVVPQALPGERIGTAEVGVVSRAIVDQLRDEDRAGTVADDAYLVVLPDTQYEKAQVVAHRLATEFSVRSARINRRNWRVAIAVFPTDGMTAEALTDAAMSRALGTRAA